MAQSYVFSTIVPISPEQFHHEVMITKDFDAYLFEKLDIGTTKELSSNTDPTTNKVTRVVHVTPNLNKVPDSLISSAKWLLGVDEISYDTTQVKDAQAKNGVWTTTFSNNVKGIPNLHLSGYFEISPERSGIESKLTMTCFVTLNNYTILQPIATYIMSKIVEQTINDIARIVPDFYKQKTKTLE